MKKSIAVLLLALSALLLAAASAHAKQSSKTAEFFLYTTGPGADGRTDFYGNSIDGWNTDSRIDYLKNYAAFLKRYFGNIKLDEYITKPDEIEREVKHLKSQPEPRVRRVHHLNVWRWALSDEGEALGWTAADFDDSSWDKTAALPHIVRGIEERDMWMRTSVRTGEYQKAFIDFEGILGASEIWVNGRKVIGPNAYHNISAPFRVDLTSWLKENADNQITVRVRDHKQRGESGSPDEPSKLIGWGFIGKADLVESGAQFIDNIFVYTKQLTPGAAILKVQFTVNNYQNVIFNGTAQLILKKWFPIESHEPLYVKNFPIEIMPGSGSGSPKYYALDFGTADSPVEQGYEHVTPDMEYSKEKGFGWVKPQGLRAVDFPDVKNVEPVGADVKRDAVEGNGTAKFKLATTSGQWAFEFMMGSPEHQVGTIATVAGAKAVDFGKHIFSGEEDNNALFPWEYTPVSATVMINGGTAEIDLSSRIKDKPFTLNGLIAMNRVPFSQRFEKPMTVKNPEVWSPESPQLYEMHLVIKDAKGNDIDDIYTTFGIVTLEDRDGELFVNGRRYRIRGALETHSFPPERDDDLRCIAPPDKWIIQDILDNRKANMNMMRFHPAEALGTNYTRWLEYADQLGMFIIWAPRQWFHWRNRADVEYLPLLRANTEPSMVATRNHPSIFAWEGGNETYYNNEIWDERARRFSDDYYDIANAIDPSRFILPISFWYAQFDGRADFYRLSPGRGKEVSWPGSGRAPRSYWAANTFWDIHPYSGWYGSWMEIWWGAGKGDMYRKDKVFFISEFGAEGMPNWELYRDERYYHKWDKNASSASKHEKDRLGRNLDFSEWEISQAYQALVMFNNIAMFRTEDADGVAICTGAEGRHNGQYFKGLRDMHRRPKLSYYATGMAYSPLFIEGLNGDMVLSAKDALEPVIVNEGPARKVNITAVFRDMSGKEIYRETIKGVALPAIGNLRTGKKIKPKNLKTGNYYSVEYVVE